VADWRPHPYVCLCLWYCCAEWGGVGRWQIGYLIRVCACACGPVVGVGRGREQVANALERKLRGTGWDVLRPDRDAPDLQWEGYLNWVSRQVCRLAPQLPTQLSDSCLPPAPIVCISHNVGSPPPPLLFAEIQQSAAHPLLPLCCAVLCRPCGRIPVIEIHGQVCPCTTFSLFRLRQDSTDPLLPLSHWGRQCLSQFSPCFAKTIKQGSQCCASVAVLFPLRRAQQRTTGASCWG